MVSLNWWCELVDFELVGVVSVSGGCGQCEFQKSGLSVQQTHAV